MTGLVFMPFLSGTDLTGRIHDPHYASVVLLLHGEGANGGSTITDSSPNGFTATVNGATTSTAQAKYGSASILGGTNKSFTFDLGTDGYLDGDFTIEMWGLNGGGNVCFFATGVGGERHYLYGNVFIKDTSGGSNVWQYALDANDPDGTWHHYAISRTGSSLKCFKDGGVESTNTNSDPLDFNSIKFGNYVPNNNLYWQGYWDEVRITNGVGRYTAAFTPPAFPFLNY